MRWWRRRKRRQPESESSEGTRQRALSERLRSVGWQLSRKAASGAGGAVTGTALTGGSPLGAVAGAAVTAGVEVAIDLYTQYVGPQRTERVGEVVEGTADDLGGMDVLRARVTSDPVRLELFGRVVEAASSTTFEANLKALRRALIDGLDETDKAHEARVFVDALADLDEPHAYVLSFLTERPRPPAPDDGSYQPDGWQTSDLRDALPGLGDIMDGLVAVLSGRGLISDLGGITWAGSIGPARWAVTPPGRRCLELLDMA